MAFATGTANSFSALLTAVLAFVTGIPATPGCDWTVVLNQNTHNDAGQEPYGANCREVVLSNTGLSGAENVRIGIREWYYMAFSAYGWDLNCYTAWNAGQAWNGNSQTNNYGLYDLTWNRWKNAPMLTLHDDTMAYWIFSNKQRIIVIAKTGQYYQSCYMGFGDRFGTPTEYPFPYAILGSGHGLINFADVTTNHHYAFWPTWLNGYDPSQTFHSGYIVDPSAIYSTKKTDNGKLRLIPSMGEWAYTGVPISLGKTLNDKVLMNPIYVVCDSNTLMTLDGVRHCPCMNIASEDILVEDSEEWIVFSDIYRQNFYDYCCINSEVAP